MSIDKGPDSIPDFSAVPVELPCPVCLGAGAWDRKSGALVYTWPIPPEAMRCPFCDGSRKWTPRWIG
jgi:hypothetical protein